MSVADLFINAAYVSLLASTFTRTLNWLRVALVLGAIFFIIFGSLENIRAMVAWNIAIGGMHLFRLARDLRAQRAVKLSSDEISVRDDLFDGLSDFDFGVLWCMGETVEHPADSVIVQAGTVPDTVSVVMQGHVAIEQDGSVTRGIRHGGLIGEMSFISGEPADVNVIARGHVTLRQWQQRQLVALDQMNPSAARAFRALMSRDLVAKARA